MCLDLIESTEAIFLSVYREGRQARDQGEKNVVVWCETGLRRPCSYPLIFSFAPLRPCLAPPTWGCLTARPPSVRGLEAWVACCQRVERDSSGYSTVQNKAAVDPRAARYPMVDHALVPCLAAAVFMANPQAIPAVAAITDGSRRVSLQPLWFTYNQSPTQSVGHASFPKRCKLGHRVSVRGAIPAGSTRPVSASSSSAILCRPGPRGLP